jgi:hypothetical protein
VRYEQVRVGVVLVALFAVGCTADEKTSLIDDTVAPTDATIATPNSTPATGAETTPTTAEQPSQPASSVIPPSTGSSAIPPSSGPAGTALNASDFVAENPDPSIGVLALPPTPPLRDGAFNPREIAEDALWNNLAFEAAQFASPNIDPAQVASWFYPKSTLATTLESQFAADVKAGIRTRPGNPYVGRFEVGRIIDKQNGQAGVVMCWVNSHEGYQPGPTDSPDDDVVTETGLFTYIYEETYRVHEGRWKPGTRQTYKEFAGDRCDEFLIR